MTGCPAADALTKFLDAALDAPAAARVEAHVEGCAACQTALDRLTGRVGPGWLLTTLNAPAGVTAAPPAIPGYELLGEAGRGGHGVVYRAKDFTLGREVAVKVLRYGAHATATERGRFLAEARAAARLRHPGVLPVFAAGEADGLPYLVSEWAAGGTLADRLDGTPLPAGAAAALVVPLARAADHAHRAGVTHRDIKPANVLLPGPTLADPRLGDFGLARLPDAGGHTPSAATLGTPSYMAPERAAGDSRAAGPAADVYALGAVLYELLAGRPPFAAESPFATLVQVREPDPVPPRRLRPGLPRDLETVCLRCLEKEPRKRYPSAAALADDLERFLAGRPVLARPAGRAERLVRLARRHPKTAALAAALATVLAGSIVGLAALWRRAEGHAARADDSAAVARRRQADAREALGTAPASPRTSASTWCPCRTWATTWTSQARRRVRRKSNRRPQLASPHARARCSRLPVPSRHRTPIHCSRRPHLLGVGFRRWSHHRPLYAHTPQLSRRVRPRNGSPSRRDPGESLT